MKSVVFVGILKKKKKKIKFVLKQIVFLNYTPC